MYDSEKWKNCLLCNRYALSHQRDMGELSLLFYYFYMSRSTYCKIVGGAKHTLKINFTQVYVYVIVLQEKQEN